MNTIHRYVAPTAICIISVLAASVPRQASGEPSKTEAAQALLEEAKTSELERKITAKQTELTRLNEDLNKAKEEADGLEKTVEKVGNAVVESNGRLEQLSGQKKRLTEMLELVSLRIEAEKAKIEGLKLLGKAQSKATEAISKRNAETDLKTSIAAAEMSMLSPKALPIIGAVDGPDSGSGKTGSPGELRKRLPKVSHDTSTANLAARDAMNLASAKLQQADAAGAKAARRGSELGIDEIPPLPGEKDTLDVSASLPAQEPALPKKGVAEKKKGKH